MISLSPEQLEVLVFMFCTAPELASFRKKPLSVETELEKLGLVTVRYFGNATQTDQVIRRCDSIFRAELTSAGWKYMRSQVDKYLIASICAQYESLYISFTEVVFFLSKDQLPEFLTHTSSVVREAAQKRMEELVVSANGFD